MAGDLAPGGRWRPAPGPGPGERVLVGVSGGVDSAVACARLAERGCELLGVTTRNFCFGEGPFDPALSPRSCCSSEAIARAAELCDQLGIAHHVLDVAEDFTAEVVDDYIAGYAAGTTPSPCVRCNTQVRFPGLHGLARKLGIGWVATGHYARRVTGPDGRLRVQRGVDRGKDQSYFLYRLSPELLARSCFPLGELEKPAVREAAAARGLAVADLPDSQELCFVPDGDRRPLLGEHCVPGDIVHADGTVLGRHEGLPLYTPGQRRGLGVAGGEPLYVLRLEPATNRLVVGPRTALAVREVALEDFRLDDPCPAEAGLVAQTRYRHRGVAVQSIEREGDRAVARLADVDEAPAPGQAFVIYRDDVAVGGGRITATPAATPR